MLKVFGVLALTVLFAPFDAEAEMSNPLAPVDTSSPSATFQSFLPSGEDRDRIRGIYRRQDLVRRSKSLVVEHRADASPAGPRARCRRRPATRSAGRPSVTSPTSSPGCREVPDADDTRRAWAGLGRAAGEMGDPRHRNPDAVWIEDGPRAGEYLFSGDSIERLPDFHALIINQPPLRPVIHVNWHEEQIWHHRAVVSPTA